MCWGKRNTIQCWNTEHITYTNSIITTINLLEVLLHFFSLQKVQNSKEDKQLCLVEDEVSRCCPDESCWFTVNQKFSSLIIEYKAISHHEKVEKTKCFSVLASDTQTQNVLVYVQEKKKCLQILFKFEFNMKKFIAGVNNTNQFEMHLLQFWTNVICR